MSSRRLRWKCEVRKGDRMIDAATRASQRRDMRLEVEGDGGVTAWHHER